MAAPRKYDEETRARAVRMYQDRIGDGEPKAAARRQPPCVVLVDDNSALLEQLANLLPEFGVQVAAAVDRGEKAVGAIAEALATDTPVNVVLMDVRMPGIGGLEATRQVRTTYPDVQVLLYTAFAGHLEQLAGQVGAFAEVPKGVGVNELVDAIWHASQHPPVRTPAAS